MAPWLGQNSIRDNGNSYGNGAGMAQGGCGTKWVWHEVGEKKTGYRAHSSFWERAKMSAAPLAL